MYAITKKLKEFREAKGLTQSQTAEILNMEQTTYGKIELGKSSLRFETAVAISKLIEKDISEFTTIPLVTNNVTDSSLSNSSVNGNVSYTNCNAPIPDRIINIFEELLVLFKSYFKAN